MEDRIPIEKEIVVRGTKIVLLVDEVKEAFNHQDGILVQPSTAQHEHIWVREANLVRLRNQYPAIAVYGLWQTLLASKLIDPSKPLYCVKTSDPSVPSIQGVYLVVDNGRAKTSGRFIGSLPAEIGYSLDDATFIENVDLEALILPRRKAVLPAEAVRERQRERNLAYAAAAICAIGVLGGGWVVDLFLEARGERVERQVKALDGQTQQAEADAQLAMANTSTITAADLEKALSILTRLSELRIRTLELTIPNQFFNSDEWRASVLKPPLDLSFAVQVVADPGKPPEILFAPYGVPTEPAPQ